MLTGLLQPTHLILILAAVLLFLGPKRLPEAGRSLGQGLKEFKNSMAGAQDGPRLPTGTAGAQDDDPRFSIADREGSTT